MRSDNSSPSLLTPKQREYIRKEGDAGIEPGSSDERAIRARIRERLQNGLRDLAWLSSGLESRDRKSAIEQMDQGVADHYAKCISEILPFLFTGLLDSESKTAPHGTPEEMFQHIVSESIENSFAKQGLSIENFRVEVIVEEGPDFEELSEEEIADQPLRILRQMKSVGEITEKEFDEITRDREDIARIPLESGVEIRQIDR